MKFGIEVRNVLSHKIQKASDIQKLALGLSLSPKVSAIIVNTNSLNSKVL